MDCCKLMVNVPINWCMIVFHQQYVIRSMYVHLFRQREVLPDSQIIQSRCRRVECPQYPVNQGPFWIQIEGWNSSSQVMWNWKFGFVSDVQLFERSRSVQFPSLFPSICDLKQFPATDFHRFVYGSSTYFIQMFAHWYRPSFTWRIPKNCFTCFAKISTSTLPSTEGVHIPHYQDMFADHQFHFSDFGGIC